MPLFSERILLFQKLLLSQWTVYMQTFKTSHMFSVFYETNFHNTVNSRFKKDVKLQIHLHKAFFSEDRFLGSLHKSFLNQTTLDLRKEKWTFLNQEFAVISNCDQAESHKNQGKKVSTLTENSFYFSLHQDS
jgi:hypothetical protein